MAAAILHFGQEINTCFPFLRQRGYSIHFVQTIPESDHVRQSGNTYDIVSSADDGNEKTWLAAEEARKHLLVPAILFQVRSADLDQTVKKKFAKSAVSDYDLVIAADETPQSWISKLDELVSLGQRLRRASKRLIANSRQLRQEAAIAIDEMRMKIEQASNHVSMPIPNMLADRILKCTSCGESFVFTAGQQLLFHVHSLRHVPDKCSRCISNPKAR